MTDAFKAPTKAELDHALKCKELDAGKLGAFFGNGDQPAKTTACIVAMLASASALIVICSSLFISDFSQGSEILKTYVLPSLTLSMGYLFGNKS